MTLEMKVLTDEGEEVQEPYLLRISGWTEERYFAEAPEMHFAEFEDGDLIMHSPVNIRHQRRVVFLSVLVETYVRGRTLGEVLTGPAVVRLRPGLDYEPDIFFVPTDKLGQLEEQYFSGSPPFVLEVISPSTRAHDLRSKAANYRQYGVLEYWVLDLERQILYQHLLPEDPTAGYRIMEYAQGRLASKAMPGFWIEVSWLWQDPVPEELACLQQILTRHRAGA